MFQHCVPHPILKNVMICDEVPVVRPLELAFTTGAHFVEVPTLRTAKPQNTIEGMGADMIGALL